MLGLVTWRMVVREDRVNQYWRDPWARVTLATPVNQNPPVLAIGTPRVTRLLNSPSRNSSSCLNQNNAELVRASSAISRDRASLLVPPC